MVHENRFSYRLVPIDRFSPEKAWDARHFGVGWARKVAMDAADADARIHYGPKTEGIIVCMDADTVYPPEYLRSVREGFAAFPQASALANPYFHPLSDVPLLQVQAMLHYETYMRSYLLNMMRTRHPYAFTAVGSSMACRLDAYRRAGGISPFKSGEDFYFLQKMAKTGAILTDSPVCSFPSSRLSSRVFFGTGPALDKGLRQDWKSYPIYPSELFARIREAYDGLPELFDLRETPAVKQVFTSAFGPDWWVRIRQNSGGRRSQFVRSCIEKFDALRSLQFLKTSYRQDDVQDWENLKSLCRNLLEELSASEPDPEAALLPGKPPGIRMDFSLSSIRNLLRSRRLDSLVRLDLEQWICLRDFLFLCERRLQRRHPLLPCL